MSSFMCIDIPCLENNRVQDKTKKLLLSKGEPTKSTDYAQEICSIDINTEKTWIVYITKRKIPDEPQYFLTISEFKGKDKVDKVYTCDITKAWYHESLRTCTFLSISPDGKRVAVSFIRVKEDGFSESSQHNPNCLVYKVDKEASCLKRDKTMQFQGRAVFSKNNDLMLINKKVLKIYNEKYSKTGWLDLRPFGADLKVPIKMSIDALDYMLKPRWAWIEDTSDTSYNLNDINFIITISRHIRHNVLITPYETKAQVWSITEKGVRLTSILKRKNEEIMAFSSNYKFLATFLGSDKKVEVNVYNVKSGSFLYKLTPKRSIPPGRNFEVSYVRFCVNDRYLVMVGLEKSQTHYEEVVFEAWHIESEQSIYSSSKVSKTPLIGNKIFTPFVMTRKPGTPRFENQTAEQSSIAQLSSSGISSASNSQKPLSQVSTPTKLDDDSSGQSSCETDKQLSESDIFALYETADYHKGTKIEEFKIKIYGEPAEHDVETNSSNEAAYQPIQEIDKWIKVESDLKDLPHISDTKRQEVVSRKTICYVRWYDGKAYLLQFGKYLIQLWRLKSIPSYENGRLNVTATSLDKLLFIHAYKAANYGFTNTFRESWSLKINTEESISFIPQNDANKIDRIIARITMDKDKTHLSTQKELKGPNTKDFWAELFIPFKEIISEDDEFAANSLQVYLRSSCQALHYLHELREMLEKDERFVCFVDEVMNLFIKTETIVMGCILRIKDPAKYKYFCTIAGSNILAMLASFKEGRKVIFRLLQIENLPISLFSYARKLTKDEENEYLSTNENALTVLIEKLDYDLYKLLFNRIISDSKVIGIGSLSALTDVLVFLQETSNNDLLLKSSQKLSYLSVNPKIVPILDEEKQYIIDMKLYKKSFVPDFRMLKSYYFREQIMLYKNSYISYSRYKLKKYWKNSESARDHFKDKVNEWFKKVTRMPVIRVFFKKHHSPGKAAVLCVVPLPHFLTYTDFPEDRRAPKDTFDKKGSGNPSRNVIPEKTESAFVRIASNQTKNSIFRQGDTVLEVLLQYKWHKFIFWYFLVMYGICITYYITYSVGISFPREVYGYVPGTYPTSAAHITCLSAAFISITVLIVQEVRQFLASYDKELYFWSLYNWVDWTTYSLSIATFSLLITGGSNFEKVNTFATFFLWMHAILKLRIIPIVGITIETILELINSVKGILLIMVLIICAFTNSFITLLSHKEDEYFQESYSGVVNFTGYNEADGPNTNIYDSSSQNAFSGDVFSSFVSSWFLLFGVWDPIMGGDVGGDQIVNVIMIVFSFLVILIFSNIFIAYMNSAIEDVMARGKKAWISHFASVVAETEQLWCRQSTVTKRKNNPTFIYYIASEDAVNDQEEILKKETRNLVKKIKKECVLNDKPKYTNTIIVLKNKFKQHRSFIKNMTGEEQLQEWNTSFENQFDELIKSLDVIVHDIVENDPTSEDEKDSTH